MDDLELVSLSEDGSRLVLASSTGTEFALPVDDRLRAALRGDRARLGQLEIEMESALRPRDIQARIRAGESPEAVAQLAQVPVDRIMGYAVPVLAERRHVAEQAQRSGLRRRGGEGPGRVLGDAVSDWLRASGVEPEAVDWDAARRDDRKWTVTVSFAPDANAAPRQAHFVYDTVGRYVVPEDEDAHWMVNDQRDEASQQPAERRLSAVPSRRPRAEAAAAAGSEALPFSGPGDAPADPTEGTSVAEPVDTGPAAEPKQRIQPGRPPQEALGDETEETEQSEESGEPTKREKKRGRRGRASVPSWDEIMFGGRKTGE